MSYNTDLINLLPDSILNFKTDSNNEKLWRIFALEMDAIHACLNNFYMILDYESQAGVILDLIGEIVRERRNGKDDIAYKIFLALAIKKALSDGSIDTLNEIIRLILGDYFIELRELFPSQKETMPWAENDEYQFWLDGSCYLDGSYYLSSDVFQPAFFEIRISSTTPDDLINYINTILIHSKGVGINFRIMEV